MGDEVVEYLGELNEGSYVWVEVGVETVDEGRGMVIKGGDD